LKAQITDSIRYTSGVDSQQDSTKNPKQLEGIVKMFVTVVPAITALAHQSIIHQFIKLKKKQEGDEEQAVNNGALPFIIFSFKNNMHIHTQTHPSLKIHENTHSRDLRSER